MKLLFKITLLIIFVQNYHPAFADEAADKADFKKLYAEFNDLYTNSEAIGSIIEVGEKLYILTPKVYGKNHINTAFVTYNLAGLYDEKGGDARNADEKRAFELYDEYFKILEALNTPYDHDYVVRYFAFVKAEYNAHTYNSNKKYYKKLLRILKNTKNDDDEKATIYFTIAKQLYGRGSYKEAQKIFNTAKTLYQMAYDKNNIKVGETLYWIARTYTRRNKTKDAIKNFEAALHILEKSDIQKNILMTLTAYKALIQIYSKKGDTEKATPYVLAHAYKRPDNHKQLRDPIYKFSPDTPGVVQRKKAGESIIVIIEFDVDENGFTKDIFVSSSNNKTVERIALKAVKSYRYSPMIINGSPRSMNNFQDTFMYTKQ